MTESIKEKIRKLLAKADNTACTVEEAKAFNDKAYELMQRYNLDRAMLGEGETKEQARTHKTLQVLKRPWSSAILHGITKLYYCRWFFTRGNNRTDTITIVGEESNVAVCHAICVMVLRAVQSEARITGGGRSFMTGASNEIYHRCLEMAPNQKLAAPVSVGQSNALMVLADNEDTGNVGYIKQSLGITLSPARKSQARVSDGSSFAAGKAFGAMMPLRQNLIGGK